MSSGEADALKVTVLQNSQTSTANWIDYPYTGSSSNYNLNWNIPVYYYQLTCPKCSGMNWAEIDKVTTCRGKINKRVCGAKLKAVFDEVDYEIPVVKPNY